MLTHKLSIKTKPNYSTLSKKDTHYTFMSFKSVLSNFTFIALQRQKKLHLSSIHQHTLTFQWYNYSKMTLVVFGPQIAIWQYIQQYRYYKVVIRPSDMQVTVKTANLKLPALCNVFKMCKTKTNSDQYHNDYFHKFTWYFVTLNTF